MPDNIPLAIIIALTSLFLFRYLFLQLNNIWLRAGVITLAVVLCIPSAMFLGYYMWQTPSGAWFFNFHSLPAIEASSGFIFSIVGITIAYFKLHNYHLSKLIISAVILIASVLLIVPFGKQLAYKKVNYSELKNQWKDGICRQTSGTTCMPACCATVVKSLGGNLSEKQLAEEAGTNSGGTEMWYMMRVLRKYGYKVKAQTARSLKDAHAPSVIGLGTMGHVVVLLSKTAEGPEIGDPIGYRRRYTWNDFNEGYKPKPVYFVISK